VAKAGNDLDAQLDALYAAPLSEFVGARDALSKSLGASGRKEDAARVKALKKPSAAAWAVNQLALDGAGLLAALETAGARLRKNPADVKDALRARREALNEAVKAAGRALSASGHSANSDVPRRISATLEAIAAYAGARGGPIAGRLTEDVPAPGFDEIAALGLLGGVAGPARRSPTSLPEPRKAEQTREPKIPSKESLARLRSAERQRKKDAAQHAANLKRAATLKRKAQSARARVAAAEKALEDARAALSAAERALEDGT
jgi:hypothetical protein